jgi:hypothetical protein
VNVRFTHVAGDAWLADYALPEPVRALAFQHPRTARDAWRVLAPSGATLVGSYVVSPEPFTRLRVELKTNLVEPDKEYRAFYRYTDDGWLVYTGQLAVARASCSARGCQDGKGLSSGQEFEGTITLARARANPAEGIVVYGQTPAPEAKVALTRDGTYAYFGALAPVEAPSFVGVLDRGMPAWMRDRVSGDLHRLFALYAERLGPLEGPRPTVFLAFTNREHGVSLGGGVLKPRLVTIDLELGATRAADGAGTLLDIDRLVAHEAAHFWNADRYSGSGDPRLAWLAEGGADALAARALHASGVLDDDTYRGALSRAASECALWLSGGEPLTASSRMGHARAFYVCGSTLSLVAEGAVRRRGDPHADLFTFWSAVFAEGQPLYDETTFLRVLDRLGGNPAVTDAVRRLVHDRLDDPTTAVRDALRLVGVETTVVSQGPWPADYEQHASIPAMDALLPKACARALTFDGDVEVRPRVGADGACPGLARGDVIDRVAGTPVGPLGATSLRRAHASCRANGVVEVVTSEQRNVSIPCELKAASAPEYFAIVRPP